jgi:hypothetical protein
MKTIFLLAVLVCVLVGCSQPLRTLMDLGSEQKGQQNLIAHENAKFKAMCRDVDRARLKPGMSKKQILDRYGAPVLIEGSTFLYRKPAQYFNTTKIYLDFNDKDILTQVRKEDNV